MRQRVERVTPKLAAIPPTAMSAVLRSEGRAKQTAEAALLDTQEWAILSADLQDIECVTPDR